MRISVPVFRLFQVLIVGLILCGPVFAAEDVVQTPEETLVTTPEPTPEATPEPTISSTPEITPTATPAPTPETPPESTPVVTPLPNTEPTVVATETPAAEPTPVVTDTVAAEPTPAATEEPTAEPTPDSGITTPTTSVETPAPGKALSTTVPIAALSANKTSWSAPAAIRFYDRSTGSPTSRIWDFGDGTNSTLKNPEHVYSAPGSYTVSLTVINDLGSDTRTSADYIQVYDPIVPVAALSANKTSWSAPAAIRFYDRSTGFPTTWLWDFGDGTTSTVKNPEHVYSSAGTYTVSLLVTNNQGSDTKVATNYITVSDSSVPVAALSANKTAWSAPAAIRFYDRSAGFPTSWLWDFGDGTTSTVKNPEHVYAATGTYTVTLTLTNVQGSDTKIVTDYITVNDASVPVAALSANKTAWSAPAAIRFYDRSAGFPTSWLWDFGDGTTSTVKNPEHVYSSAGTYTVSLLVTNNQGSDTKVATDYITVSDSSVPVAALSANKTAWSAPAAIRFYDRSAGFPTSWNWDFGDGTTSTVKNPEHVYAATGNYSVTLTVTNDLGTDTATSVEYIHVYDAVAPVAALSANKTAWSAPAAIRFYDRSTGFPTSWSWDFGDGTTSDVKNPEHVYGSAGTYSVTLTVTNVQGSDTKIVTDYITVNDASVPVAALSANKTAWSSPAPIRFYDRSTGFPTSWNWDFGDGTTSDVKNPAHEYTAAGTYTVTLTVTNDQGSDTKVATDYVTVTDASVPVAALSANRTTGVSPAAIRFYDRSTGFPTTWSWDFGDGTTSDVKNPIHIYTSAGNYTINLTVTNALGSSAAQKTGYIRIAPVAVPLEANFTADMVSGPVPLAVTFTDQSTGPVASWNWSFGDDSFSDNQSPGHLYSLPGNYTVSLRVADMYGSQDTATRADYIRPGPPQFVIMTSANVTYGPAPLAVQFTDMTPGDPDQWNWSFGDGVFSDEQNPVHTYLLPGNFTLNRTVSNVTSGNTAGISLPDYISVTVPAVSANFTAEPTSGTAPLAVNFTDFSTGLPASWNWSFGDGNFSAIQHPSYTFLSPGNFTVNLTVDDGYGGNDTLSMPEYVRVTAPFVVSNFTANATSGQAPFAVAFTDLSEGFPTAWNWSFGDGTFSGEQHPTHNYVLASNYTVSLVASNAFASDNRTVAEYVKVEPATPAFDAEIILNSLPATMFQGEHYIVDIKVNNTGTETWYADPANANLVYLQGLGGPSGEAAKFNITHIPMIFTNETVAPGESYDFFFYVQAPDIIGNYTPEYQVATAAGGVFGPVANATVNVIANPFHPEKQPDGSKLYTTTFGNTSSGVTVSVVGPRVYIDKIKASSFNDPRFLINPTLKSGIFDLELNESYSYADITLSYNPSGVSNPSELALGYFNESTGNYTFIPSTVDTASHTVTTRVTPGDNMMSGRSMAVLNRVQYFSLPVYAQNEMGYIDIGQNDNWTIYPPVDSYATTYFGNGVNYPPGNYTILTSGSYTSYYVQYIGCVNWVTADSNPDNTYGYYVNFNNPVGGHKQVQKLRVSSGILKLDHKGGPISVYHSHIVNGVCGSVGYRMYYGDGPVFRDGEYDFRKELDNDQFNATELGYDLAVTAYHAAAGCVLGQAGHKGGYLDSVHSAIPGWNDYINDDVTESPAYLVGHVACAIAFPEIALARDFTADVLRGDLPGAALNSLGYLGPVKTILKNSDIIPTFLLKNSKNAQAPTKLTKYLVDNGLIGASHDEAIGTLDKVFAGSASRLIDPTKNTADDLINTALKGFDLKKVHSVVNSEGKTTVLTNDGLDHIIERHIKGTDLGDGITMTSFWPVGETVRPGVTTPNVMTQADVERFTVSCLREGSSSIDPVSKNLVYRWAPNEFGIDLMNVYVKPSTGEILTSFPVSGSNVLRVW